MAASIDVVVPVHNRYELTAECLRGLRRQRAGHRVIVVDDASGDATPQLLRDSWPEVTVVELERNVGFTRAVNAGVRAGSGEIVVLVNNDVQLHEDFLEHVTAPLAADAAVGSVAALLLAPGEGVIDSFGVTADPTLARLAP